MKHLTHWILALIALATVASLATAWTNIQEPPQQEKPVKAPQGAKPIPKKPAMKGRSEKQEALKKALPTMKTSLAEGITLCEKSTGGKAFSAGVELAQGKATIQVNLFVGDKATVALVDPETKVVTVNTPKKKAVEGEGADHDGEGDEHDEDGN